MKTIDIMRRAGRNLRQAKVRTLLTALAISVGAFTITLALAAGTGAKLYTDNLIASNGDDRSLMVFADSGDREHQTGPTKYNSDNSTASQGILSDKDIEKIRAVPGVHLVTPLYRINADYMTGLNGEKYNTSLSIKNDHTKVNLVAGSLENQMPAVGTALVSESYIEPLGFSSPAAAIGKSISVYVESHTSFGAAPEGKEFTYKIAAVDSGSKNTLQYQDSIRLNVADGKAIYEYQTPANASGQYYGATVAVDDKADVAAVQQSIKDKKYQVFSQKDMQDILFTFVNVVMGGVAGFGALAILASVFGIINTQYISVLERTQQIGLMKALGASRRDIGRLFRYEAAWVGFLGGMLGTLFALLVGLVNPWITETLSLEPGTNLLVYSPLYSTILVIALVLIAVAAGYFPSRKASRVDPIEALRTE